MLEPNNNWRETLIKLIYLNQLKNMGFWGFGALNRIPFVTSVKSPMKCVLVWNM